MKKMIILIMITAIVLILGVVICMDIKNSKEYNDIQNVNKNENFNYDETNDLDYNKLKYYIFSQTSIEELDKNYPIEYLKQKNNIYYAIYSLKNNKLCYIVFKETDGNLHIDFSWVYSNDMIDSDKILNIESGTNCIELDEIDKNTIKIDEISSTYFTLHFFKDGGSAMLEIDPKGNISKITKNDKNIFSIIYTSDYPQNIIFKERN